MKGRFFGLNPDFFRQTLSCLFLVVVLTTCFNPLDYSPSGNNGLISIALPGAGPAKAAITPGDLTYELTFSGPNGQSITRTAAWGETCTVETPPGLWTVTVTAKDGSTTKAIGKTVVDVIAGSQNSADIKLAVYTEVSDWTQLQTAIAGNTPVDSGFADELIVVTGPITATSTITFSGNKTVTIVARENSTITRDSSFTGLLIDIAGSTGTELILGLPDYTGELTFDGNNLGSAVLIKVTSGKLTMNNGVTLTQNAGGAVECFGTGTFIMNGGNITKNTRGSGAGVYVTGTFIMNGGVIGGSAADKNDATYTYGGGVYIATSNGRFTMNGGEISYNNATDGGGVVINTDAVFTMNGGVIKSNMASTDGAGIFNTGAAFNISGNAQVSVDNEVFLASGKTITVTGPLDHTLMVTLNSPANNTPVLTLPSDFLPAWFAGKIEFTHGETYSVDSDGKLVTPDLVTEFSLDGKVTAPVKGATPVTTGTGSNQYDVSMVVWKNNDDSTFTGTYFLPDTAYKAVVTLTAKSGYTFNGVATGSFTYTGVSVAHLAGTGTSLSVTITFLKTADFASPHRDMISVTGDTVTGTDSSGVFPSGRTVTINNFKIAKYEVTYQLWKEVYDWAIDTDRGVNQYTFAHTGSGNEANQTRPVGNTGWRDAIVWCNAYSELSGKEPVYAYGGNTIRDSTAATCDSAIMDMTKTGYRLPTEAEWEYAARGGPPVSPYWSYAYAGSATADDVAWHAGNADNYVHPVGTKDPNSRGLYDMSGNVWEYCWDRYGSIGSEIVTDPTGPTSGATSNRVRRGGSYTQYASQCTVDSHNDQAWIPPATHSDVGTGFRVVCK